MDRPERPVDLRALQRQHSNVSMASSRASTFTLSSWNTPLISSTDQMSEGTEVWRECMRWLGDAGVLDADFIRSAGMTDFVAMLKDGIILCKLANVLVPNAVDKNNIAFKASSQFNCTKNITHFTNFCTTMLDMRPEDVFAPFDLYNASNFLKVLNTLSLLSYSHPALARDLVPFPRRGDSPGAHTPTRNGSFNAGCIPFAAPSSRRWAPSEKEEQIYSSLQNEDLEENEHYGVYAHYQNQREESEEKVYDVLVKKKPQSEREEARDPATARWLSYSPVKKRDHIMKEILDTEQNYVENGLNMISKKFFSPLDSILKREDHKKIFINIADLWQFHTTFYAQLRDAVFDALGLAEPSDGRPRWKVGDVFVTNKNKFTLYGPYCMGLDESRAKILALEKNDAAARNKIAECCSSMTQFKLQDLLCLPMQRVLKYHLLLRELLKHTEIDDAEYASLSAARDAMEDVNSYVNELKRDMETTRDVEEIQASIIDLVMPDGLSMLDYGREHKDGEMNIAEMATSSSSAKFKRRHCFLFDKVFVVCKANRNNTYTYKVAYVVSEMSLETDNGVLGSSSTLNSIGGTISRKLGASHTLTLNRTIPSHAAAEAAANGSVHDMVRVLQLQFKSEAQKTAWTEAFRKAKTNVRPNPGKSGHSPHFKTFIEEVGEPWPPECALCKNYLKGMFYQGYACDRCKQCFHKECIALDHNGCQASGHRMSRTPGMRPSPSFSNDRFRKGERVETTVRFTPSDSRKLTFDVGDELEIIVLNNNGTVTWSSPIPRMSRKPSTLVLPRSAVPLLSSPMQSDYINTELDKYEWYKGELTREESVDRLRGTPNGTFLVRYSQKKGGFAISISYANDVKHTVVEEGAGDFFLDENSHHFQSIVELINYYKEHNLRESFNALDTNLTDPYRETKRFRVIHAFEAPEQKFLELRVGDTVQLVDTMGEERGWWKGKIGEKVGFFPLNYVEPIS